MISIVTTMIIIGIVFILIIIILFSLVSFYGHVCWDLSLGGMEQSEAYCRPATVWEWYLLISVCISWLVFGSGFHSFPWYFRLGPICLHCCVTTISRAYTISVLLINLLTYIYYSFNRTSDRFPYLFIWFPNYRKVIYPIIKSVFRLIFQPFLRIVTKIQHYDFERVSTKMPRCLRDGRVHAHLEQKPIK